MKYKFNYINTCLLQTHQPGPCEIGPVGHQRLGHLHFLLLVNAALVAEGLGEHVLEVVRVVGPHPRHVNEGHLRGVTEHVNVCRRLRAVGRYNHCDTDDNFESCMIVLTVLFYKPI